MESPEDLYQAELDADETQDEILNKGGIYPLPFRQSVLWKVLLAIGVPILFLGLVFWYQISGFQFPSLSNFGAALMPLLAIFLVVLGAGCVIAGIAVAARSSRDPYDMEPIR